MATRGQKHVDAQTGDTVEFVETASDTNGKHVKVKWLMKPGGIRAVKHIHPFFDETFEVISGKLTWEQGQDKGIAKAGDTITLTRGLKHSHNNLERGEDLVMYQTFSPALDTEDFVETIAWLSANGRWKGQPEFLQALLWQSTMQGKTYLAAIPVPLQNTLSFLLSPMAKALGYKMFYHK